MSETSIADAKSQRASFWDQIEAMRADSGFEPVDLTPQEVRSWRDRSDGRDFQWPQ